MTQAGPTDFRVRAYMVLSAIDFLRERVGTQSAARIYDGLSPTTRHVIATARSADWCSVAVYSEVVGAVAALANGNDAEARETLIACGEYVAGEATNTFLKLVMKLLSPARFAQKLPDFWRRDCSGGRLAVETTDTTLTCRLLDMTGLDHGACTGAGFVKFALSAMGKRADTVSIHNWSLSAPCTNDAWFELKWVN